MGITETSLLLGMGRWGTQRPQERARFVLFILYDNMPAGWHLRVAGSLPLTYFLGCGLPWQGFYERGSNPPVCKLTP